MADGIIQEGGGHAHCATPRIPERPRRLGAGHRAAACKATEKANRMVASTRREVREAGQRGVPGRHTDHHRHRAGDRKSCRFGSMCAKGYSPPRAERHRRWPAHHLVSTAAGASGRDVAGDAPHCDGENILSRSSHLAKLATRGMGRSTLDSCKHRISM